MNVGGGSPPPRPIFVGKGSHPDQNSYNLDGVAITTGRLLAASSSTSTRSTASRSRPAAPTLARDARRHAQSRDQARHQRAPGLGPRALTPTASGWDYGVEAGGPLWKDHLWLWGAGARNAYPGPDRSSLTDGEPVAGARRRSSIGTRSSTRSSSANTLTLSYTNFDKIHPWDGAPSPSAPRRRPGTMLAPGSPTGSRTRTSSRRALRVALPLLRGGQRRRHAAGGLDEQADLDGMTSGSNSYVLLRHPGRQAPGRPERLGLLRHRRPAARAQVRVRLPARPTSTRLSSWPGDQLVGVRRPFDARRRSRAASNASCRRTLRRPTWETRSRPATSRSTSARGSTTSRGRIFPSVGSGQSRLSRSFCPPCSTAATPDTPSPGARSSRASEPRTRSGRTSGRSCAPPTPGSPTSWAHEVGCVNAFPGIADLYYCWNDANGNGRVEPDEIDFVRTSRVRPASTRTIPAPPSRQSDLDETSSRRRPTSSSSASSGRSPPDLSGSLAYTHRSRAQPRVRSADRDDARRATSTSATLTGTAIDPTTGSS